MNSPTLRPAWWPWSRRQAPAAAASIFDARREQARLSEGALRQAARLLGDQRSGAEQVQGVCDGLVAASTHLRLCWTWFGRSDAAEVVPEIVAGPAAAYARQLRIGRDPLTARGPAFRALDGRRAEPFNVNEMSLYGPWRRVAREHGVRSVLALPLAAPNDGRCGLFVLYADIPDYFAEVGVGLFEGLAEFVGAALSQARRQRQLARLAHTDALTGLYNRAAARDALDGWPAARPLSLLLLDLDHFKQVNDQHGHAAGDAVLVHCAQRLQACLRRNDGLARWGGEEFLVWLPDTGRDDALQVADKLRAAVADAAQPLPDGTPLRLTVSAGVAALADGETLDDTVQRADRALYAAKHGGRNRVAAG